VITVKNVPIGGNALVVIAGPCAIENRDTYFRIAKKVKAAGANMLRGGAFKPRTSPHDFQGLGLEALKMIKEVRDELDMPVISEAVQPEQVELVAQYADVIQIGARNMHNIALLKEAGRSGMPILLKRSFSGLIKEEWLRATEYLQLAGNEQIILCERGIRTFEQYTRNTLDLSAVPIIKELSNFPIIVDPSHATGRPSLVPSMALAGIAAGADGVMIEVHDEPTCAKCDGHQALSPSVFAETVKHMRRIAQAMDRTL